MRGAWTPRAPLLVAASTLLVSGLGAGLAAAAEREANPLLLDVGRAETRVFAAPHPLPVGRTLEEARLLERLEALDYERVSGRPDAPGSFFWGHDHFWIFRRAFRHGGRDVEAESIGLRLRRSDGRIDGVLAPDGAARAFDAEGDRLEPELLAESLEADRAPRRFVALEELPEHAWRAVLAAEDHRFFDHPGVDARAVARALLANVRAGGVAQGGSTITQQLVKNRELTPKRTLGRKASEALRALALEAEHSKEDILEAYLDTTYWGHRDGVAIHGLDAAARAWLGKGATEIDLAGAAVLAGMIRAPNRLTPARHPRDARERRDQVLDRMVSEGWADAAEVARVKARGVEAAGRAPSPPSARLAIAWAAETIAAEVPRRLEKGRGVVVETTLDAELQRVAAGIVARRLEDLRESYPLLRELPLQAAAIVLDARSGDVIAHVGGDPSSPGGFDRARHAKRQPGSAVKPFVLLEAFEDCDGHPLHPLVRLADEPLRWELPSGPWEPVNPDGRFRGTVLLRDALADSLNVPLVRLARHCGLDEVAETFERAGLELPAGRPPAFILGAVEATPVELAEAFAVFSNLGDAVEARMVSRVEKPEGRRLERIRARTRRVASPEAAWLVRDVLRDAVAEGTARIARLPGVDVVAKTGTSSERRDAWMVGAAGGLVAVVWVGLDEGGRVGLTGSQAAGPIWHDVMEAAVQSRVPRTLAPPDGLVVRHVDPHTGLLVRERHRRAEREWFREEALPDRKRWWRADEPYPVIR